MTCYKKIGSFLVCALLFLAAIAAAAQQQLGSITGTVSDQTDAVISKAEITLVNNDTGLKKTGQSRNDGTFFFTDLPIGTYTLTFNHAGFKKEVHGQILVQANRTATIPAKLQAGTQETTVEVTASPLLNKVDTTNGYVMGSTQIEQVPLATGSFTQLAVLSPGVNADFLSGADTNAGLGNQSIWANGQRDTSNSVTVNSVSASNIFNGKTSSSVSGNRNVLNTGESFNAGGQIQTNTSVYDAIGNGIPTPPVETIEELRVNTSMYDASQGANSGAHIEVATRSGTNAMHGQAYGYRMSDALNAAPYFFNQDPTIAQKVPELHRGILGGAIGGPIVKDKLFYFGSYQWTTVNDAENGIKKTSVPTELTDDRSTGALLQLAATLNGGKAPAALDPIAVKLMQFKLPNGQFLVPSAQLSAAAANSQGFTDTIAGPPSTLRSNVVNGNLDYNLSGKDQMFFKYLFQSDPTTTPFANGVSTLGFPQQLLASSQVASLQNVTTVSPTVSWDQKIGFIRERAFSTNEQPLSPQAAGIGLFGSTEFPGISIHSLGDPNATKLFGGPTIGPTSNFANTGAVQNQIEFTSNLTWNAGRHTFQFGGNYDYSQLNILNLANQVAGVGFNSFEDFLTGNVDAARSQLFEGSTSRYYRSGQAGMYASDKIRLTSTLNFTLGLRYDWDGPLSEKNGNLINFDPTKYQFNLATDTIVNDGLVFAGNNKQFATQGVSNSTLTGRQWGFAPRLGLAWSPKFGHNNVVVRAGWGMYYDRGEFFTELSPTAGGGIQGPFGATLQPPSVQQVSALGGHTFANPFGGSLPPINPSPQAFQASLPNLAALSTCTPADPNFPFCNNIAQPFEFGGYDPRNTLPYSENWNLDLQWQPRNDMVLTAAYIGNRGVHLVEPIPFNQPGIATPQHAINGQTSSYGYNVGAAENISTFTGGNTDLRVPFVGLDPNSVLYQANGISFYNALQLQFTKRLSHGLTINTSYTYSHTLDEGSGLGLFFNGNNALDLRQNYGSSDFDRTHVLTVNYVYQLPKFASDSSFKGKVANGWGISGVTTFQSGQPYSIIDFSGAQGSIFYSSNDFITNPIVPLAPGFTPATAKTGHVGSVPGFPAFNPLAFAPQFLQPGQDGVPADDPLESAFSNGGRNIFRGAFQKRADLSIFKVIPVNERISARYTFDIYNVSNTPSFDTPNNNLQFSNFNNPPAFAAPGQEGGNLGVVQHSLGSPRLIQMSLHITF